jgi:hypothetical protein
MGANATTFVPAYVAGEVLTAADLSVTNSGIPVFATTVTRDAAFGGTGEKTLAEGQFAYLEDTNTTQYYDGAAWQSVGVSPGMVLVATATPTAVSSVSINNCFTSAYENYRVLFTATGVTVQGDLTMRLRAAATDTTTNYTSQLTEGFGSSLSTQFNLFGSDDWYVGTIGTNLGTSTSFDIYRPQTAQRTAYNGQSLFTSASPTLITQSIQGIQTTTTQFDGFTFLFSGTNFTGTIRVYGYANS